MEAWRKVFREGFAPGMNDYQLIALKTVLELDSPILAQGATTNPPPLSCNQDAGVESCCAISLCGWLGDGLRTVGEVEEFFARACYEADKRLGEPAACRWFLNWFDDSPRDMMRQQLLAEVEHILLHRNVLTKA